MKLDVLVVAAHPDDAEIAVGGTLLRLKAAGAKIGIVDITRGEMGSRGTQADRDAETAAADKVMQLDLRENLGQPDSRVQVTIEAREALAGIFRRLQPDVVIAHHTGDLHPDHVAAGQLAQQAWYLSGLRRLAEQNAQTPRRPPHLFHFFGHLATEPSLVVDVGAVWDAKEQLIRCYNSQLVPDGPDDDGKHFLFGSNILERVRTKARYWGEQIGALLGEPLLHQGPLPVDDPLRRWLS